MVQVYYLLQQLVVHLGNLSVTASTFTAVAGRGYWINTTSNALL
jgi:hypothetical protein